MIELPGKAAGSTGPGIPFSGRTAMSHLSGKFFHVTVPTPHVYLIQATRAPVNAFNER